ncbi:hypothetical protein X798_06600 [Onchocerca flexuosa]|uniref:Uncharacterized protein n=1 Tax=Onchocerca flexuosa TaxID=387005 RepID=A0A238BMG7_9BILA|nr:hypothetical protein X798_06600 [Onchocerca flexuosa]
MGVDTNVSNIAAPMTTAANYPVQSQQIYSNVNGSGCGTYIPYYYNASAAQNITNIAASVTTTANYPVQSQQIYSNVNGNGYDSYVPTYYNAPAAHITTNFATTMQNATSRQGNVQMNRYSVSMSISYNTSQYQYTASGQSSTAMTNYPQSVVHPFVASAAARTSFSQDKKKKSKLTQTYT